MDVNCFSGFQGGHGWLAELADNLHTALDRTEERVRSNEEGAVGVVNGTDYDSLSNKNSR